MKKLKIGLLGKILIAIALGVGLGLIAPAWMVRIFLTFNGIFSQFLGFAIPLIIVGLVAPAISDIGKTAGKMLLITVGIAYGSTVFAGIVSYLTGATLFPGMIQSGAALQEVASAAELEPFFTVTIPPLMNVMTALILAFTLGLGLAALDSHTLKEAIHDFEQVIIKTIKSAIIPLLPLYIFGIFLNMTYVGQVFSILTVFIKIIGIIFLIHIGILILQFAIAGGFAKKNPFKLLWTMMPAYFTALGTQSSAATIPVTLEQTRKNGVSDKITDLVIPLCSNVHLAGSMANMVVYTAGFIVLAGEPISLGRYVEFMFMLSVIAVASPGIPGGVVLASGAIAESVLGFSPERYALVIATYMALDGMGTACNLTGDGAIAVVMDRFFGKKKQ